MRQLNIILGNLDEVINELLSKTIEKAAKEKNCLNIVSFFYMEDIEDYARKYPIDLFVIVVNNVNSYEKPSANQRIEKTLQFIKELKDAHNRPVIALYGWPKDPDFPDKVIRTGANFCFKMPCKMDDFEKAVRVCFGLAPFEG